MSYAASNGRGAAATLAIGALMKRAVSFAVGGAIIVAALTAWLAPGMIAWYFNPPVEMGGFSCTPPITWALKRLQWAQLWGVIVGGVLGLVVYGGLPKETHQDAGTTQSCA